MNENITLLIFRHCHSHLFRWWWWLTALASQARAGTGSVSGQRCTLLTFRRVQFGGQVLCFGIQMAVPKGALSLRMKWEVRNQVSVCLQILSTGSLAVTSRFLVSCLARAVCLWLVKVLSDLWSLFYENPIMYTSRWQVRVWAWSLTQAWHDGSVPEMYLCNKNL